MNRKYLARVRRQMRFFGIFTPIVMGAVAVTTVAIPEAFSSDDEALLIAVFIGVASFIISRAVIMVLDFIEMND